LHLATHEQCCAQPIQQAIRNIIANATKCLPEGASLRIESAEPADGEPMLSVADRGRATRKCVHRPARRNCDDVPGHRASRHGWQRRMVLQ